MNSETVDRILDLAVEIQQVPAPTFNEKERAILVRDKFTQEGLEDISVDDLYNVYGRFPGEGSQNSLVITAHLDTVFPIGTDLQVTRKNGEITGPGLGDNSLGVAGLFGLIWLLKENKISLPGDLWLVANSCEEGLGNLKGMRKVVDRFKDQPLAYIILEGMAYRRVYHRGLGVRRYRITAKTPGGHSWGNFGTPSAIHELSKLITKITLMKLPATPRSSFNVGKISGGLSINTIAPEAEFLLDLRSESSKQLEKLTIYLKKAIASLTQTDVQFSMEKIGEREAGEIPIDHPLVELAVEVLQEQGEEVDLNIGSTDANIPLSQGYPAICIGLTDGGGPHTTNEFIFTDPLAKGTESLLRIIKKAFTHLK